MSERAATLTLDGMFRTANRWFEENRWAGDAIVAGALLVVLGLGSLSTITSRTDTSLALTVLLVLPLFFRRTYPLPVLLATIGISLLQLFAVADPVPGDLVIPIVVHAAAAYIPERRWGYLALAAGIAGSGLATLRWLFTFGAPGWYSYGLGNLGQLATYFLAGVAVVVVAYLLGIRQRERRDRAGEQLAALDERNRLLTAERDTRVEMGAAAERARIARELHDIVAHSLSVIIVQADGGAAAARTQPEIGPQVLETIAATSRDSLAQMRRMVSVLRSGPGGGDPGAPDYAPAPGPADLDDLVTQVRSAGLPVTVDTVGSPREMTQDAGLAVYRVVQESLTNVLKHAGPAASCRVVVHYGPGEVVVTVTDDGRGAATGFPGGDGGSANTSTGGPGATGGVDHVGASTGGHGLEGMRERVGLQGGSVAAGPRLGGGFEVTATVPYRGIT